MKIIGIDPSSLHCGYGIIEVNNSIITHITHGVISPKKTDKIAFRLSKIFFSIKELIEYYDVNKLSLETAFVDKNKSIDSALKLSLCRGTVLTLAGVYNIDYCEVAPAKVKKITTGSGAAPKTQVRRAIKKILKLHGDIPLDASDALGIAIAGGV